MTTAQKVTKYFKNSYFEMKHVTWPTRKELKQHTILVIVLSLAVAAFLGLCDYILNIGFEQLIAFVK
jgi:preprotein translocase subunit SecE